MSDEPDALADEAAIIRVISRIAQCTDRGDDDGWVECYTPDGRHVRGDAVHGDVVHEGHEALRAHIVGDQPPNRRGLHMTSNTLVERTPTGATAVTDFLFVARAAGLLQIIAMGEYHDQLVRTGAGWRIAERRVVLQARSEVPGWPEQPDDA